MLCSITLYLSNMLPFNGFHLSAPIATGENIGGGKILIKR
jgi:hypothetical protein